MSLRYHHTAAAATALYWAVTVLAHPLGVQPPYGSLGDLGVQWSSVETGCWVSVSFSVHDETTLELPWVLHY